MIRTDHAALTYLQRTPEPIGQQARWLDLISEYNFVIRHRSGDANRNADGLSRRPCETEGKVCRQCRNKDTLRCVPNGCANFECTSKVHSNFDDASSVTSNHLITTVALTTGKASPSSLNFGSVSTAATETDSTPLCLHNLVKRSVVNDTEFNYQKCSTDEHGNISGLVCGSANNGSTLSVNPDAFTKDALRSAQISDADLSPLLEWRAKSAQRPGWKNLETRSEETRTLWAQYESLELKEGVLYRRFHRVDGSVDYLQLVMPRLLRETFLQLVHSGAGGHFAVRKTADQVQRRAYWPGWRRDVEKFIRKCLPCAQSQSCKPSR